MSLCGLRTQDEISFDHTHKWADVAFGQPVWGETKLTLFSQAVLSCLAVCPATVFAAPGTFFLSGWRCVAADWLNPDSLQAVLRSLLFRSDADER